MREFLVVLVHLNVVHVKRLRKVVLHRENENLRDIIELPFLRVHILLPLLPILPLMPHLFPLDARNRRIRITLFVIMNLEEIDLSVLSQNPLRQLAKVDIKLIEAFRVVANGLAEILEVLEAHTENIALDLNFLDFADNAVAVVSGVRCEGLVFGDFD